MSGCKVCTSRETWCSLPQSGIKSGLVTATIILCFLFQKRRRAGSSTNHCNQTRVQPTEPNTAQHNSQSLLVVVYPTTNKCLVAIGYPTTNIHHFISWCCVPNTNNCWVVLCTQLFSKKDPAWEKNHSCLKGSSLVQKTSLLWLFLIFGDKFNK